MLKVSNVSLNIILCDIYSHTENNNIVYLRSFFLDIYYGVFMHF